jgi:hypothetical protein
MIRQSTDYTVLATNIYNICKEIYLENLVGRILIESLIAILKSNNYTFKYKTDTIR